MTEVVFLDPALAELRQAALWYDQQETGVGREFLTAVDQGLNRLLHAPTAWPIAGEGTHRQSLDRFRLTRSIESVKRELKSWPWHTTAAGRDNGRMYSMNSGRDRS